MIIKEAEVKDLESLLRLYTHFGNCGSTYISKQTQEIWNEIVLDKNYHMIINIFKYRINI